MRSATKDASLFGSACNVLCEFLQNVAFIRSDILILERVDLNFILVPLLARSDKYFTVTSADIFSAKAVATN